MIVPTGVQNDTDAQILTYLKQGYNEAYGTIELQDISLDESVSTIDGGDGVDDQGNGQPPVGATGPTSCGDDEVHRIDDTTLDFALDTCGSDDAFTINYNVLGTDPQLEVKYRDTNTGLVIGGNVYRTDTTIPLDGDGTNVTDTDNDGIVDSIENQTIPLGNGQTVNTSWNDSDTDGDGLKDGAEILLSQKNEAGYKMSTDPTDPDTDGDGCGDLLEANDPDLNPRDADTDDDGLEDCEDPQPATPQDEGVENRDLLDSAGHITGNAAWGAILGDAGSAYPNEVSWLINKAPLISEKFYPRYARTVEYFLGWIALAIASPVDILADVRDCIVLNTGSAAEIILGNALDCGGAAISIISSIGTGAGAALSIPSGGLSTVLSAGGLAIDIAEDVVTDLSVILARAASKVSFSVDDLTRFIIRKTDIIESGKVDDLLNRLSGSAATRAENTVDRWRAYSRLENTAEFSEAQARALKSVVKNTDTTAEQLARIAGEIDEFDSLRYPVQESLARQIVQTDEPINTARRLNGLELEELRRVTAADVIRAVDDTIAGLSGRYARVADDFLSETGIAGHRFMNEISPDQWRKFVDEIDDGTITRQQLQRFVGDLNRGKIRAFTNGVLGPRGVSEVASFMDNTGRYASDIVNSVSPGKVNQILDFSADSQSALKNIVYRGSLRGDADVVGNVGLEEVLDHVRGKSIDISELQMITKSDGKVVSLSPGNADEGLRHIDERHFTGTQLNTGADQTTFFPSGSVADARGSGSRADLPNLMSEDDLAPLLREAVEDGSLDSGQYVVEWDTPRYGVSKVVAEVDNGQIATAYPEYGPAVRRWNWNTGQWEEYTGSGWTKWSDPAP